MKKVNLTLALTGLLLVSCANDDLVVKPVPLTDSGSQIAFDMNLGNISRSQDLHTAGYSSFGVWAVKANTQANFLGADLNLSTYGSEDPSVVMNNYWVKYCTTGHYGSYWSYVPEDWSDPTDLPTYKTTQYLKYWDGSVAKTYFVAYGPAVNGVTFDNGYDSATPTDPTLTFPFCETNTGANNFIYSDITAVTNNDYITTGTTDNPKKVPLKFYRIFSQLQIAIYEDIPGYDVEMESLCLAAGTSGSPESDAGEYGIAAIPADYTATSTWARGKYLYKGNPKIVYTTGSSEFDTKTIKYTAASLGKTNFNFALPTGKISETKTAASKSGTIYNVIANTSANNITMKSGAWSANSGLQFVMNYKLKSKDTNEEIHVKGARVYVNSEYTKWEPNTVYTYIFRITKNSSGTTVTGDATNPKNDPAEPAPALYPIIFDDVTIEDLTPAQHEFAVNEILLSQSSADLTVGGTLTLTATSPTIPEAPATVTWSSSNEEVATVDQDGSVTAIAAGTATITATATVDGVEYSATCTITVTAAATTSN